MQELKSLKQSVDTIFTQEKLEKLSGQLVEFQRAKRAFGKSQSQWMDINLTASKPTPIRSARQCLAQIEKSYSAIKETEYKIKKLMVEKEIKKRDWDKHIEDNLKLKLTKIEFEEIDHQIDTAAYYFEGALKTVQTYIDAYESICKSKNIAGFDELDFEYEEEEYHIKTALMQSLRAVRRCGTIDEGNQEYLEQCGIDPGVAQRLIIAFLNNQNNSTINNFSMETTHAFIHQAYLDFQGLSVKESTRAGISNQINTAAAYIKTHKAKGVQGDKMDE